MTRMLLRQIPRDVVQGSKEILREVRAVGMADDEFWAYPLKHQPQVRDLSGACSLRMATE